MTRYLNNIIRQEQHLLNKNVRISFIFVSWSTDLSEKKSSPLLINIPLINRSINRYSENPCSTVLPFWYLIWKTETFIRLRSNYKRWQLITYFLLEKNSSSGMSMPERIKTTKKRYCESSRSIYNPYPFVLPRIIRNNKKKKKEEIKEKKCEHAYRKLLPLLDSRSCSYGALKWNIWLIRVVCRFRVPRTLLSLILASSCFISARRSRQIGPGFAVVAWEPSIDFDPSFRNMENLDTIFLIVIHCVRRFKWVINGVSMASNIWSSASG